ncbi:hypothetical protein N0V83_001519 [Neocucurbitaria cava]|uniref:Uncharacterized protein n=1 Tax=Neocucurbitaria cava TaxID=798079 RepID=A0A9W9CQH3_9PLEO|nr:hypothetical protein N0V83_001519 [Neocucurbitaria cava]
MIFRIAALFFALNSPNYVIAEVAPDITTIAEGYNLIAKLPCIACPYLYQDTSKGKDEPWTERKDDNALLLNISLSLPFDVAHLSINNAPLFTPSKIQPRIYANQVFLDTSVDDLHHLIASNNQLDSLGGAYFGLSYAYSLQPIKGIKNALVFHFDILQLWSDLPEPPITVVLDDAKQKMLEVVFLQRPLLSAGDAPNSLEIVRAELVPRPPSQGTTTSKSRSRKIMNFHDWDAHGKKGTPSHLLNSASASVTSYLTSGAWALFLFIMAIIALFVLLCL